MSRNNRSRVGWSIVLLATWLVAVTSSNLFATGRATRPRDVLARPLSTPWLVTLPAVADTWAWNSFNAPPSPPPAIHGRETALITGIDDTRGSQWAFLRFDLSQLPGPPVRIVQATLRLSMGGQSPRSEPRASDLHAVLQPWDEATLADEQVPSTGAVLATAFPDEGGGVTWSVTGLVSSWQQGAANHGLAISSAHDLFFTRSFASREASAGQPVLEVILSHNMTTLEPPTATRPTSTPLPPIATCPTPGSGTPTPPGLYPYLRFDDVRLKRVGEAAGCGDDGGMTLEVCFLSYGPAPTGAFRVRVQGCVAQPIEVAVSSIDMFTRHCVDVPVADMTALPCEILIDASCSLNVQSRVWSGLLPTPAPLPTCEPPVTPSATPSPVMDIADLTGIGSYACFQVGIGVTVYNRGLADAGPFTVRSTSGQPSWRVPGLMRGAELRLPVRSGSAAGLTVDADNEVWESREDNNLVIVGVPHCTMNLNFPLVVRLK